MIAAADTAVSGDVENYRVRGNLFGNGPQQHPELVVTSSVSEALASGFSGLPIRARVGLHVGEAFRHADDFYGRTVVIAARIGALALGGEILASDLVYALARGLGTFSFGDPRSTELKGLDGTFDLYPVLASRVDGR